MIFTCDYDPEQASSEHQYIKDDKGYIIGSVLPMSEGWRAQSCIAGVRAPGTSWGDVIIEPTRMGAINAAIADYIARRMIGDNDE